MTNFQSGNVSAFSIGSGGGLTAVSGSPFAAGGKPYGVAVSPDGAHLYVTNENLSSVSAFSIGSGGGLTAVSGSPFASGSNPIGVAVSPDGAHLYVTNFQSGNVSAFSIGSGGGLTAVSGSPFAAGTFPVGVVVSPDSDLALTNVPGNMTVNATGPGGAVVTYTPPTVVDEDAVTPNVHCLPKSGSLFAIGETTVTCTVSDADDSNSPVSKMFSVTVNGALAQLEDPLLPDVKAMPASIGRLILVNAVNDMINNLQAGRTASVCSDLTFMTLVVQAWSGDLMTTAQGDTILADINQIIAVLGCNAP